MMNLGGCAAETACDLSIFLALNFGKEKLYPYDLTKLEKEEYIQFALKMKKYLKPRMGGISKLNTYTEGFGDYLKDLGENNIQIEGFSGEESVEGAKKKILESIDGNIPVPYLLLSHKSNKFRFFKWHWFLIVGYEKTETDFLIKVVTYGNFYWLNFEELWRTGYKKCGGMIIAGEKNG